jgi:hypothetical protein
MKNLHPISFYLNQKFVFDILAILEDGFSEMQTLKRIDSNAFGFLGVNLGGYRNKNQKAESQEQAEFTKIHTPNSLFAKMREVLFKKNMVRTIDLLKSKPGEFVEFKAVLRKNPMIDSLENYFSIFKLAMNFQEKPTGKDQKNEQLFQKKMLEQFDTLLTQLKAGGNIDLIGEHTRTENLTAVLPIDSDFLNDPSLNDLADGEFSVFGKVIKVLDHNSSETVNLLRKTSLSKINDQLLDNMFSGFENLDEHGLKNANFIREIKPPVVQVIPISIFT